jgi:23S rRNA (uridine2552-2'-O)-methyltransferase
VGVYLQAPTRLEGVFLPASVFDVTPEQILEVLDGPAHVLLSDMAPRTSGVPDRDHYVQIELADAALSLAVAVLAPGGSFVVKVFDGPDAQDFQARIKAHFGRVKRVRPEAVRKVSREFFLVATGFRA